MFPDFLSFQYLKHAVSIEAVMHDKGLSTIIKKRGDQLFGPCPVHGGDNPRDFVVSLKKTSGIALQNAMPEVTSLSSCGDWTEKPIDRPLSISPPWLTHYQDLPKSLMDYPPKSLFVPSPGVYLSMVP